MTTNNASCQGNTQQNTKITSGARSVTHVRNVNTPKCVGSVLVGKAVTHPGIGVRVSVFRDLV